MSKVAVIGAGAAGTLAAIRAGSRHDVVLIDGNDKCGKKLLLTGNGRCNYWNSGISSDKYNTDDLECLESILSNRDTVLNFLEKLGLYPKIKDGYYYPYSNQAASVAEIFKEHIKRGKIKFESNFKTEKIQKTKSGFSVISSDGRKIECEKLIVAAGSKAYPKTGSDGSGYSLAKAIGHSINEVCPALTGLISKGRFLKEWEKIRCDAKVSLFVDGKLKKEESGEIQLTSTGISGICTFNLSGIASRSLVAGRSVSLEIDFVPFIKGEFYDWFSERCELLGNPSVEEALESIFNYKLMFVLLKEAGIDKDDRWSDLTEKDRRKLCRTIEKFNLNITGTEQFERAQVCTGGVPLKEVDGASMESKLVKDLYFAGEILDADGVCGGYNLAFAFISGYLAGGLR